MNTQVCEEVNAISLASADAQGRPSVRVVLLKGFDTRGFTFYTNYNSRKGQELLGNGMGAFSVYWEPLQRQVGVISTRVPNLSWTSSIWTPATALFFAKIKSGSLGVCCLGSLKETG